MKISENARRFAEEFRKFLANADNRRSTCTIISYKVSMNALLEYARTVKKKKISTFGLDFFTYENLSGYMEWLRYFKNNSPQTCNLRLSQITSFLKYLAKESEYRIYYINACKVDRYKVTVTGNIVEPLTKDAMEYLLHAPGISTETGVKYSMLLSLLYSTATRISEVLSLQISDVHIHEHKPYILVLGKGKRYRRSPLYQQDVKMLRKYILRFHGTNPDPNAYLFYSKCKGKYEKCTTRSVNKQLDIYVARVRQEHNDFPEHVHSHQFRHSMATHLIDDGVNVFNVSKILGHQSVATTMKYIGITPKMTEKAISQIESTSLRGISAKWKGNAKLEDLIK